MMTHKRTALLSIILTGLILVVSSLQLGLAAADINSNNGMSVSPVVSNLTISPGDTQVVAVYIKNVTKVTSTLQVLVNDFRASSDESGTPALLLTGERAPTHSLKQYISPIGNITLQPGEQKKVNVEITIPKGAPGGGYYGAVRFAPASVDSSKNVNLSASVASLILVRVPGNFKEQLNLASLDVRGGATGSPSVLFTTNNNLVVAIRFQNIGDIQEQPFGKVSLRQGNKEIASYEINNHDPRGNVLPDSTRLFTAKLDKVGVFGKYTLYGNFGYGVSGQLISGQTTFYVIPWPAILGGLIVLAVIALLIFVFPKLKKQYDRGVLARARRR